MRDPLDNPLLFGLLVLSIVAWVFCAGYALHLVAR